MEHSSEISAVYMRLLSDVGEAAVPVIAIQNVLAVLRDVQIRVTVVVIIAPDATQPIGIAGHASPLSHVGKGTVAVVPI
jgi:hypothetical protein